MGKIGRIKDFFNVLFSFPDVFQAADSCRGGAISAERRNLVKRRPEISRDKNSQKKFWRKKFSLKKYATEPKVPEKNSRNKNQRGKKFYD